MRMQYTAVSRMLGSWLKGQNISKDLLNDSRSIVAVTGGDIGPDASVAFCINCADFAYWIFKIEVTFDH